VQLFDASLPKTAQVFSYGVARNLRKTRVNVAHLLPTGNTVGLDGIVGFAQLKQSGDSGCVGKTYTRERCADPAEVI
jgi:hypothetical protein